MKRKIAMLFGIGMLTILFSACGGNAEDVSGTYKNVSVFPNNEFILNSDETWDGSIQDSLSYNVENKKGLFEVGINNITLNNRVSDEEPITLKSKDGYYYRDDACFSEDDDYGKEVSFDENGRSNQVFASRTTIDPVDPSSGVYYGDFYLRMLQFNEDGTFSWFNGETGNENPETVEYEGTYTVNDDIITLNYDNADHYLIFDGGSIYYDVYQKQN